MLEQVVSEFKKIISDNGQIKIITHLDTDGLSSAAILIKILRKLDQQFSVVVVRQLEDSLLEKLFLEFKKQKYKAIFFLDLGSNKLEKIMALSSFSKVFVLDHHEIGNKNFLEFLKNNPNLLFFNPEIEEGSEKISASSIVYSFVKLLDQDSQELSQLAVLGMVGDMVDKSMSKLNGAILNDAKEIGLQVKKGPIVFSATRPLHKSLELSSSIFIPGITGCQNGVLAFLREIDIQIRTEKGYRTMLDLTKEEMSRLLTAIVLARINSGRNQEIVGNIYLVKLFGHLIDCRELSTMINACGRLGYSSLALSFLLGSKRAKDKIEYVYSKYRHYLIDALNFVSVAEKIQGKNYIMINAENNIRDTIIGTVTSILASSFLYPEGTVIIGLAYRKSKIKVSVRLSGPDESKEINLYKLLNGVMKGIEGEVGGHPNAAGCIISKTDEAKFIENLQRALEMEEIKIAV